MKTFRNALVALLVLQLALTAGLLLNANASRSLDTSHPLLAIDNSQLDKIVIDDGDKQVTLVKQGSDWQLPELQGLPANAEKLNTALDKLAGLKTTWPVASTKASHQRFEVIEDKHQRRIQFYDGDKRADELLIGTSPGFRKAHVRRSKDSEVYALPISTYEFPVNPDDWLDKTLLAAGDIKSIKGPDFELNRQEATWTLDSEKPQDMQWRVNEEKADQLSRALESLAVTGVADDSPDFGAAEAITLDVEGETNRRYQFLSKDDSYYVKADHREQVFMLSKNDYQRLATVKLADLQLAEAPTVEDLLSQDTGAGNTATNEPQSSENL